MYVAIISVIAFSLLLASHSRLVLSTRRSQSALDVLNTANQAETEINDLLARIVGGYVDSWSFPINDQFEVGDISVEIEGEQVSNTQTILVKTSKGLATSQMRAVREIRIDDGKDLSIIRIDRITMP